MTSADVERGRINYQCVNWITKITTSAREQQRKQMVRDKSVNHKLIQQNSCRFFFFYRTGTSTGVQVRVVCLDVAAACHRAPDEQILLYIGFLVAIILKKCRWT
jgi:hypothetical protein